MSPPPPFTVAVLADTHIRPDGVDAQAAYPSDAQHTARARRVVAMIRSRRPVFTVHLGDITHTLPGLDSQAAAWTTAREVLDGLDGLGGPLHVAPGNHDVGDKHDSHATAPPVNAASCRTFEERWGPNWSSWDHGGCHFAALNASLINSGLALERAQRAWLEADLAGHDRTFLFLHYAPFILRPDEPSHYDNLAQPGRGWLLGLLRRHRVEALFAGHAHHFFYGRLGETSLYSVPSTAFTRPEYSELFAAAPAAEFGRDDTAKLGCFLVHVGNHGHRVEPLRTALDTDAWQRPAPRCPLGVWLRGGWHRVVDLPCGDLDEFRRKSARNDYPLLALLDLRVPFVRVPLADLGDADSLRRLTDLSASGIDVSVFSAGVPGPGEADQVARAADLLSAWEIVLPPGPPAETLVDLATPAVPLWLSRIRPRSADATGYVSHFPLQGLHPDDADLDQFAGLHPSVRRLAFRVPPGVAPAAGIAAAAARAADLDLGAVCHVELPRGSEARIHDDDRAVADRVLDAARAAEDYPDTPVFVDLLEDKDRGYYPRHGLIDRLGNPRLATIALRGR